MGRANSTNATSSLLNAHFMKSRSHMMAAPRLIGSACSCTAAWRTGASRFDAVGGMAPGNQPADVPQYCGLFYRVVGFVHFARSDHGRWCSHMPGWS
jgi:hypothetical protein